MAPARARRGFPEDPRHRLAVVVRGARRGPPRLHHPDPESWRRGAGRLLWDELVRWSRARGAARIAFEVASGCCGTVDEAVTPVGTTPVCVTRYTFDLAV